MRELLLAPRLAYRAVRYRFKLNPQEIAAMMQLLPRGGTGLDVGAHKGAYAWWMARAVGRGGMVIAFEPQERVLTSTARAFAAGGLTQVRYVHAAVSDRSGQGTIGLVHGSTHGASVDRHAGKAGFDEVAVPLVRLDDLLERDASRVDFVKIDVEGHETAVLRGASAMIDRFHPALLIECEGRIHKDGSEGLDRVRSMLEPRGYRGEFFTRRERLPLEQFDPEKHQKYGHGYYSNNFLFTRRSTG